MAGGMRRGSVLDPNRKLTTRTEHLAREELRRLQESSVEESSVTDEDLLKVFEAYARKEENGKPAALNPMQFSTIWRLLSGDKGNLFKEMQMFNKCVCSSPARPPTPHMLHLYLIAATE